MGLSLYRLHLANAFDGTAGFDMDASHVFPQGVLAAVTSAGGGAGVGEARARARCEAGLLLCLVVVTTLAGVGSGPKLLGQKP